MADGRLLPEVSFQDQNPVGTRYNLQISDVFDYPF